MNTERIFNSLRNLSIKIFQAGCGQEIVAFGKIERK
jgi:hypothetical protein